MASLAGDIRRPGPREIAKLLAPFPGRAAIVTRIALICALTVLVTAGYGTPDAATGAYIVFFLNRPDRMTSVVMSIALMLLVTVIIGIVMIFAIFTIDQPPLRVASIALLSFGLLFATSASKLRPIGAILAMIVGFGLDELGLAPLGEAATRGLMYAWLMVAIPIGVAIAVNLVIAPSPRRLATAQLARRLRLAARRVTGTATDEERAAFDACMREGDRQILTWLKLSKLEGTLTPADGAALRQAAASTTAVLIATDFAASEPGARLPDACAAQLAETMTQMAAMLEAGGYPVDVTLAAPELPEGAVLPALVLADLRAALEGFAVPPAQGAAAPVAAPEKAAEPAGRSGFFDADAFSNPDHVRYALKTTAAAMFCYVLYQQLDWPGIHTCFITCYMVSLSTTAETVEKLTLRIAGCLVGALLGTAAIVFVTPRLTSVGELMALVFAGAWLAAWVAMGSARIAYAGMQIAFAFFLCVIQGAAPAFDLTLARDRVIGILIGNVVVYLVFTRVWPVSIASRIDATFKSLVAQWSRIARAADARTRSALAAGALAQYGGLRQDIGLIHYEPSWVRPEPEWVASRRRALAELEALEAPLVLAAGRAGAARLGEIAQRLAAGDDAPVQAAQHAADTLKPSAEAAGDHTADPALDALQNVIVRRFGQIAEITRPASATETTTDARH
ncbi:FUSC family protein [Paraburkholderia sp. CNPSo 3272]|uniref:FUSC family protein n=1 Tax=Paraburkholderia sp. CNPSo 3272 TaxID=2940931 RepID=UPI0020B8B340|nr:FUSC family protein [Paraburkholderia sp. CNPSo 3272]MCP3727926.1 FUSC family protein [Paraburkholderia sp. CNPSo 3272]